MAISIRRRGMGRLARRNAERRLGVFGCINDYLVSRCNVCHRKITIVSIGPGVGLMHAKGRSLAAFSARAKSALGHTGHGIHHGVAKLEKFFFLLANKRIELPFAMIQAEQHRRRLRSLPSGFRRTSRRLRAPSTLDYARLFGADLARRSRLPSS